MKRLIALILLALICTGISCAKPLVPRDRTAIFPAAKAPGLIRAVCYHPPEASGYWTPSESDLEGVEDTLVAYLHSAKAGEGKDWSTFRRQVAGVKRGDDALIFIYYFHFNPGIEEQMKARKEQGYDPDFWKKAPYSVFDGGSWFFRVLYDVKTKRFIWYECNGEA